MPKSRELSIPLPGDQYALQASADPGGFHAVEPVSTAYWSDPAEGERLTCRVQIKIHEVLPSPIPFDGASG